MSHTRRLATVDREHPDLSVVRRCALPRFRRGRSSVYYRPTEALLTHRISHPSE